MKNRTNYLTFLFLLLSYATVYSQTNPIQPGPKTVFIIVDGISEDAIQSVHTPNLDAIAGEGAFLPAYVGGRKGTYSETPTISAVGYNSLLTGTWAHKHNVWGNAIRKPNYNYQTIFRFFKTQYPSKKTAVFSTWLDNRTKLIGTGLDATGDIRMDYSFDGFELNTDLFPHDPETTYIRDIDDLVTDEAARYISSAGPDLSWIYLQFTDNMGHMFGDHPKFHEAIQHMDRQIGIIRNAIKEREAHHHEKWLIVITTDHGRTADTGKGHGGQTDRERSTWIVTNHNRINEYGKTERVAIVDIFPTIAEFMGITIPLDQARELDGVPLIGSVDAAHLTGEKTGDMIELNWKAFNRDAKAKLWLSVSNQFRYGGQDSYIYLGEVDLHEEKTQFPAKNYPSDFYKIVLEGPNHSLSTWIIED